MQLNADWIGDTDLQMVLQSLTDGGHTAYLVGGCVRNALLGEPVADIDIATDALPAVVTALAGAHGLKVIPTGIDHGTVTVIAGGRPHEVTTFRRDIETDGRRAIVTFSTRIEDDAARRDFTMNALYADAGGTVIDPLGGLPDLLARRVRFVGDAEARIREDYLRILRFFRFHARFGDPEAGMDPDALAACAANGAGIETLSRERIGHEMRKLLAARDPAPAVAAMAQSGILARALPGADPAFLAPLIHLDGGRQPAFLRRLAALGGEDPVMALRLSRPEARGLSERREAIGSAAGAAELAYRFGPDLARDVLLLRQAIAGQEWPPALDAELAKGAAVRFPVKAADLAGQYEGAALGQRLRDLETRWIASGFRLSREQLLS